MSRTNSLMSPVDDQGPNERRFGPQRIKDGLRPEGKKKERPFGPKNNFVELENPMQTIITAMKNGCSISGAAFDELFTTSHTILLAMAIGMLRALGDRNPLINADDALQTWDYKMVSKGFASYLRDGRGRPFFPFAIRTMWNICIDIRRRQEAIGLEEWDAMDERLNPTKLTVLSEWKKIVRNSLELLSEEQRTEIDMKYWEQLKNHEIAELLRMNSSSLGSRLYRGLKRLRDDIERSYGPDWPLE